MEIAKAEALMSKVRNHTKGKVNEFVFCIETINHLLNHDQGTPLPQLHLQTMRLS
jgi:hypothetical protein